MTFIPELGGLATSLQLLDTQRNPQELLFLPKSFEPKKYKGVSCGWPFCFPVCGRLQRDGKKGVYLYEGKRYKLPELHGFAQHEPWQVLDHSQDRISLRLIDNERTREQYPFAFELVLSYHINDHELRCEMAVVNRDEKPMPYYAGFHPYFLVEGDKQKAFIEFEGKSGWQYNKGLTDIVGERSLFETPIAITAEAVNESLTELAEDKTIRLSLPNGQRLEMSVIGRDNPNLFRFLQLYHRPDEPFFCVEPWMSYPNAINSVEGARWLGPGETDRAVLELAFA